MFILHFCSLIHSCPFKHFYFLSSVASGVSLPVFLWFLWYGTYPKPFFFFYEVCSLEEFLLPSFFIQYVPHFGSFDISSRLDSACAFPAGLCINVSDFLSFSGHPRDGWLPLIGNVGFDQLVKMMFDFFSLISNSFPLQLIGNL